jgi:hypothetical protein
MQLPVEAELKQSKATNDTQIRVFHALTLDPYFGGGCRDKISPWRLAGIINAANIRLNMGSGHETSTTTESRIHGPCRQL